MSALREIRQRAGHVLIPTLGLCLLAYVAFHAVTGERGLIAWWHLSKQLADTRAQLAEVEAKRDDLEHRVSLLRPDNLDLDMLDERARAVLFLAHPNDLIVRNPEREGD